MKSAALIAICFAFGLCPSVRADLLTFTAGHTDGFGFARKFAIENLASTTSGWQISSISINYSASIGDIRIDTFGGGTAANQNASAQNTVTIGASVPWGFEGSIGSGIGAILPSNLSTEGQNVFSASFSSFDPGDSIALNFDLDSIAFGSAKVDPSNAIISVVYTNGSISQTVNGVFAQNNVDPLFAGSFSGANYASGYPFDWSASGSFSSVPEPSSVVLLGCAGFGWLAFRVRRTLRRK